MPGGTHQAIRKAVESGRIVARDGKINAATADRQWEASTDPGRQPEARKPAAPKADPRNYHASRAAREFWEAERCRMKAQRERGDLVSRSETAETWANMILTCRHILLCLGPNLAEKLAGESDPVVCRQLVDDEVYRALDALATQDSAPKA